jgi:hypothetical protein
MVADYLHFIHYYTVYLIHIAGRIIIQCYARCGWVASRSGRLAYAFAVARKFVQFAHRKLVTSITRGPRGRMKWQCRQCAIAGRVRMVFPARMRMRHMYYAAGVITVYSPATSLLGIYLKPKAPTLC